MATVSIERELAEDLVDTKLKVIKGYIVDILTKWNYDFPEKFTNDARDGTLEEAEDDAISLRHLLYQQEELYKLKKTWNK